MSVEKYTNRIGLKASDLKQTGCLYLLDADTQTPALSNGCWAIRLRYHHGARIGR